MVDGLYRFGICVQGFIGTTQALQESSTRKTRTGTKLSSNAVTLSSDGSTAWIPTGVAGLQIVSAKTGTITTELADLPVLGLSRRRNPEFLLFLRRLDEEFPGEVALHLVMDNYGTHKHANVRAWLKRHPRFFCHFVHTSSSWLTLVGLERKASALLMDRYGGFHRREALAAPADSGADSARLHAPAIQEKEMNGPVNSWTLH